MHSVTISTSVCNANQLNPLISMFYCSQPLQVQTIQCYQYSYKFRNRQGFLTGHGIYKFSQLKGPIAYSDQCANSSILLSYTPHSEHSPHVSDYLSDNDPSHKGIIKLHAHCRFRRGILAVKDANSM